MLLHRRRREDRFLAHVAGRVGVGNIIAHHLQADLHRLQRVAAHLNRAEKTHAPPLNERDYVVRGPLLEHTDSVQTMRPNLAVRYRQATEASSAHAT